MTDTWPEPDHGTVVIIYFHDSEQPAEVWCRLDQQDDQFDVMRWYREGPLEEGPTDWATLTHGASRVRVASLTEWEPHGERTKP